MGGDEVRKRSWGSRLAAAVAALALGLGLAACGDDNDSAGTATSGAGTILDVAYVTTQQHPYGIAVDSFIKEVNGTGTLTLQGQPVYPQSEIQLLDDVRSGVQLSGNSRMLLIGCLLLLILLSPVTNLPSSISACRMTLLDVDG